jgi:diaminopimelate decarboxylase
MVSPLSARVRDEQAVLEEIARDPALGTPTYVYDLDAIAVEARELTAALGPGGLVAYAVKANSAGPIVRALAREGCGADVVSGAELELALACGVPPEKIVYSGVAKTDDEIGVALGAGARGICAIQAESAEEVARVAARAERLGRVARISLRINPAIDEDALGTHAHIATGHDEAKFGVPLEQVDDLVAAALAAPTLRLVGLTCHIGSQLTSTSAYVAAAQVLFDAASRAKGRGAPLEFVDTGGGFGIDYGEGCAARPADFVRAALGAKRGAGLAALALHIEPGRALVAAHGVLLARVVQTKLAKIGGRDRRWLLVDAGMNDLIRPALYQARHRIVALAAPAGPLVAWRVVGPVCESSDDFGEHDLPARAPALVAILDAGAYGYTMASRYNGRALPAEVFLRAGKIVARVPRAPRHAWVDERATIAENE